MKKVLVFAGSNSPQSINQQLAANASGLLNELPSTLINLREFPMEIYGLEHESEQGVPENAKLLHQKIWDHDAFVIAISENNNSVSAVFKNTMDWLSRVGENYNVFQGKPVLLLSTSPGGGGAQTAARHARDILTLMGAKVSETFSVSSFYENVELNDTGLHFKNAELNKKFEDVVNKFEDQIVYKEAKVLQ